MADGMCDVSFEGDYDGDVSPFYSVTHPKARKQHKCFECSSAIAIGEQYSVIAGKFDGKVIATKFCAACYDIGQEFAAGGCYGELWENFHNEWGAGTPLQPCLNRMHTVAAKAKLREQWLKFKELES